MLESLLYGCYPGWWYTWLLIVQGGLTLFPNVAFLLYLMVSIQAQLNHIQPVCTNYIT